MTTSEPPTRSSPRQHWLSVIIKEVMASENGMPLWRMLIRESIIRRLTKKFGDDLGQTEEALETIFDQELLEELLAVAITCPSLEAFQAELAKTIQSHSLEVTPGT